MNNNFTTRELEIYDAKSMAILHHKVFVNFFLSSLGKKFLHVFYKAILKNKRGIGIGAFDNGVLIGFAVGTEKAHGFYSSIIKSNGFNLFVKAFPQLVLSPQKIFKLINSLSNSGNNDYRECPCLLSICANKNVEFKGVGSQLIQAFEKLVLSRKNNDIFLTTDRYNNDYVNQFYLRNNYICKNSFFNGKREMNLFYKKLKL